MLIKTEVEITPRRIADLMVTAIEGGIGYWCKSVKCLSAVGIMKVGEAYNAFDGSQILMVGVGPENRGTTYETMFDELGVHRYSTRDFGRVTGTTDDPRSLKLGPWYDCEDIYAESKPELLISVTELDPCEEDKGHDGRHLLTLAKMERGFALMQEFGRPKGFHWRDFITENEDAITADVWFQLAVFGEVVYG